MIDKIKSILRKELVSAPKELPELLFEQSQVDSFVPNQSLENTAQLPLESNISSTPIQATTQAPLDNSNNISSQTTQNIKEQAVEQVITPSSNNLPIPNNQNTTNNQNITNNQNNTNLNNNSFTSNIQQTPISQPFQEAAKNIPIQVSPQISTKSNTQSAQNNLLTPAVSSPKPKSNVRVETTANSMNFIDEDMELNDDDLSESAIRSQGVYVAPKIVVSEPRVEIKPISNPIPKPVIQNNVREPLKEFKDITIKPQTSTVEIDISNNNNNNLGNKNNSNVQVNISGDNFFAKVENFIGSDTDKLKDLIKQDLFENLRIYHKRKEVGEKLYLHTSEIETAIKEKLMHLKVIEDEWLIEKQKLETQEKIFLNKEEELYSNIEELKDLFSTIDKSKKLNEEVSDDKAFILVSGGKIHSLAGLAISLKSMGDDVFNYHVNNLRNDFSSWVSGIFSKELGKELSLKKDKASMIALLQL